MTPPTTVKALRRPPFLQLDRRPDGRMQQLGVATFGDYQDVASPGRSEGIFAEWNWDGQVLTLRNCRYGHFALYYHATPERIIVSTSLQTLLEQGAPADLNDAAIAFFLRRGSYVGEDSPFQAIRQLPANSRGEWRPGRGLQIHRGSLTYRRQNLTREAAMDGFSTLFKAGVRRRAPRGDAAVPLSGGRDSRHILLALCNEGYPLKSVLTMRHFPPLADEDARVAALLTEALGIPHTVLDHAPTAVELELRKNPIMNFATDWSAWFVAALDQLRGRVTEFYSGYGGDAVTRGSLLNLERAEIWRNGDMGKLATYMMTQRPVMEVGLKETLGSAAYERFHFDLARERLIEELQQHVEQPNPDFFFTFHNALKMRVAPKLFPMCSEVAHIYAPFLDYEVFDLLASLPAEMNLDITFHTEAIHRAFPKYQDVPFVNPKAELRIDPAFFRRYAREMTHFVLQRQVSEIYDIPKVTERLSGCRVSGDGRLLQWLNPSRILCLLQLEDTVAAAKSLSNKAS